MARGKKYEDDFKIEAVKLMKEVGAKEAAKELDLTTDTIYYWSKCIEDGRIKSSNEALTKTPISMKEELRLLKEQHAKDQKKIKELIEENDFLKEASAFFAASHQRTKKT